MKAIRAAVDRFEGDDKQLAVLMTEDGESFDFPRSLLPEAIRAGDLLTFHVEKDPEGTKAVAEQTRLVQAEMKKGDDGGDLKL